MIDKPTPDNLAIMHVFIQFLAHHNALDKWLVNSINHDIRNNVTDKARVLHLNRNLSHIISSTFTFDPTPEGPDYWQPLNQQWRKVYRQLTKE